MRAPERAAGLSLDERAQVDVAVELVGFGARVADEALVVERLGEFHDGGGGQAEVAAAEFLELDGGEREGLPVAGGFAGDARDGGGFGLEAAFVDDDGAEPVVEASSYPAEWDFGAGFFVAEPDVPEGFGAEVLDAEVAVYDEAEGGELTWAWVMVSCDACEGVSIWLAIAYREIG